MSGQSDEVDRIMAVMNLAFDPQFGEAWTRRQVDDALTTNCHYALIDAAGNAPEPGMDAVGFFLSRSSIDEEELLLLGVTPRFRRRGLGQKLLEELAVSAQKRGARRLLLEMRRGNPAEALYRAFGFSPIGERPNYYRTTNGERLDAITFARTIA
jgi:ribosomal-protein-alanine N-acetyltransferase